MQPSPNPPEPISRIQENVLARQERKLLTYICARLPAWVTPDLLTAIGLFGAVLTCLGYAASNWNAEWLWLSIAGYVVHWFGDSLDGSLARHRRIERPSFGYFIDHSCDGLATLLILGGIGLSPYVRLDVALLALVGYLLLCVHTFLAARVVGEMKLSYLSAGPTELRLILIALTLAMLQFGKTPMSMFGFDVFIGSVAGLLVLLFILQTLITARRIS